MTTPFDGQAFQAEVQRLDGLVREAKRFTDPAVQSHVRALVQALLALHGAGLERILAHIREAGDAGQAVLDACAADEAVSGLLLLHGLHPLDLETRVRQALDRVGRTLRSRGVGVELLGIEDGMVRLRLNDSSDGAAPPVAAMRQIVEEAMVALAPDATSVEIEGEMGPVVEDGRVLVPLPLL